MSPLIAATAPERPAAFSDAVPGLRPVQRMRVRFVDPAHAGPAGVPEHGRLDAGTGKGRRQQRIRGDRGAQEADVVAQFSDLFRALVDQAEPFTVQGRRAMTEQGIPGPAIEFGPDRRIVRIEVVPREQQEQSGRVAAANLEPVEREESLLNGDENVETGIADAGRRQCAHFRGGPQPVAADRPLRVGQGRRGPAHRLQPGIAETSGADI